MSLKDKKIIVGISGGIAAYKTAFLIRLLKKEGADVRAIMTRNATWFITRLTIETLCQHPVAVEMFPEEQYVATHHIDLASWPDLFVVAPATANFIGKVASGVSDDMLTTVVCAAQAPVMIAPSMNSQMYLNPITLQNIEKLRAVGYIFIDPNVGEMACETTGPGRMAEPEEIVQIIKKHFEKKKLLKNKKVLITAGPCREPIDPVRFISNRSSGKMGYALAAAAYEAGAEVTLVSGPVDMQPAVPVKLIAVETTEQMYRAVGKEFKKTDILIMAAAPADFTPKKIASQKIKKEAQGSFKLELSSTIDILKAVKEDKKKSQKIIGFALETENGIENATAKLKKKGLDLVVLNSLEDAVPFESDKNKVTLIDKKGRTESLPTMPKMELARVLIEHISRLE
ncbi:MAG: bifunctional phosphopantothenoylcysteine decarboxylase/phosphopantothenate--cysteine ligase CoaBC [candidate division Zixibacteria bacterium HGW-Zixibacteria-1]|nr:MAG: bifunctional phosphopantothenoylcysteine decarboxylase/phosphopantothenate--cysteine ligase CoaBC [candidate division Zixibacteria bacterium HGW-Zixibacteria-1]